MNTTHRRILLVLAALAIGLGSTAAPLQAAEKLRLLIIDGQNNHNWKATTPVLESFLEKTGRFTVDVATSPPKKAPESAWKKFRPEFTEYDVVLSNYNGELWPEPVQKSLEKYVAGGGGVVIVHAANNAFPQWKEFNRMIGLGWRGANYGKRVTLDDDGEKVVTPKGEGPGAGHGPQHQFSVVVRNEDHPVMKGMPKMWMHAKDELYHGQRGPAAKMHILATAYSSPDKRGTGAHEPMVWWIPYGKGKVFTTVMGHAPYSMECVGFQSVVARGAEWVATGEVTLPIPDDFPEAAETSTVSSTN